MGRQKLGEPQDQWVWTQGAHGAILFPGQDTRLDGALKPWPWRGGPTNITPTKTTQSTHTCGRSLNIKVTENPSPCFHCNSVSLCPFPA